MQTGKISIFWFVVVLFSSRWGNVRQCYKKRLWCFCMICIVFNKQLCTVVYKTSSSRSLAISHEATSSKFETWNEPCMYVLMIKRNNNVTKMCFVIS